MSPDEEATKKAADDFAIARAKAINAFAEYEQSLGLVFETLLGTRSPPKSWAVFHSIRGNRDRLTAIEKMLTLERNNEYDVFFSDLQKRAGKLDQTRNKIVHWLALGSSSSPVYLSEHPDIFSEKRFEKSEIIEFTNKVNFYSRLIWFFAIHLRGDNPQASEKWRKVFHQKIEYPPGPEHPLYGHYQSLLPAEQQRQQGGDACEDR